MTVAKARRTGGCLVISLLVLTGCSSHGPAQRTGTEVSTPPAAIVPATARGLTYALLTHLGDRPVAALAGASDDETISSSVELQGRTHLSLYLVATPPSHGGSMAARCGTDSGYRVVRCSRLADGSLIEVSQGPGSSVRGLIPVLIGRATRPDGSSLLLEIHARGLHQFPSALALPVLSDHLVGWRTESAYNVAGQGLEHFVDLRTTSRVTTQR